jgi:hypothetical protein
MSLMDLVNEWERQAVRQMAGLPREEGVKTKLYYPSAGQIYKECARELKVALIGDNDLALINLPSEIAERVVKVQVKYTLRSYDLLRELVERKMQNKPDLSKLTDDELQTLLNLVEKTNKSSSG